jgi:hypothetical protein
MVEDRVGTPIQTLFDENFQSPNDSLTTSIKVAKKSRDPDLALTY